MASDRMVPELCVRRALCATEQSQLAGGRLILGQRIERLSNFRSRDSSALCLTSAGNV